MPLSNVFATSTSILKWSKNLLRPHLSRLELISLVAMRQYERPRKSMVIHSHSDFPPGSCGDYIIKALHTRGIPFGYLQTDDVTSPRAANKVFISFVINNVNYLYGRCGGVYLPRRGRFPGPLIDQNGARVARHKVLTNTLLRAWEINVPNGVAISRSAAETAETYFSAIIDGCPHGVCLKPVVGNMGRHVYAGICDVQSFRRAFRAISNSSSAVFIQEEAKGDVFRFLSVGGRVVAIGLLANVKGDGMHTYGQLIELRNARKNEALRPVDLRLGDEERETLTRQGLQQDTVLPPGQIVRLAANGGADSVDLTKELHYSYSALVERVMLGIKLRIGGADVGIQDIHTPATNDNYHFIELHSSREFADHQPPLVGKPPDIARHIIDYLATL